MGEVNIEGLGIVVLEGDEPNDAEQAAIVGALNELPDDEPTSPLAGSSLDAPIEEAPETPIETEEKQEPREGPLGIVPKEARGAVREEVEKQPGLIQLLMEVGPSMAGAIKGAQTGAKLPLPGLLRAFGVVGGAIVGGVTGEVAAQETGIAPESELNIGLAAAGPLAGPVVGGVVKGGRRVVGAGLTRFPFAKTARAKTQIAQSVEEFESLGSRIISKQTGQQAKTTKELFTAVREAGVKIPPEALKNTHAAIEDLLSKMSATKAFPEVKQAMKVLEQTLETIKSRTATGSVRLGKGLRGEQQTLGISLDTLVSARQQIGIAVGKAESAGGAKLGAAKQAFKAISADLGKIARDPSLRGRAAKLVQEATKRAKLDFSIKDMEAGIAKFTTTKEGATTLNVPGLQKWVLNITNPKSKQFNKNLSEALKDELPEIKSRLKTLAEISAKAGNAGGPGSLVVRGKTAGAGAVVGGLIGGPIGAGTGAIIGAGLPETMVAILMSPKGTKFLEGAAKLGKGQINMKTWVALGQLLTRSAGEQREAQVPSLESIK